MKILTATSLGQGSRTNDFDWTVEGELVWVGLVCAEDLRDPDGGCGCGRAFSGMSSHRATTTAQVRDLPLTRNDLLDALIGYYDSAGYGRFGRAELTDEVDAMLDIVRTWKEGTVVERRLDTLRARAQVR